MAAARNHYETLELNRGASNAEIRAAYRKLVLKHHPDRSTDPRSTQIFIEVAEAFEVLSDPERRRPYDRKLEIEEQKKRDQAADELRQSSVRTKMGSAPPPPRPSPKQSAIAVDVTRLSLLFSRGQFGESERLAKEILDRDRRQPVAYAVLGDLARARGQIDDAARYYSTALQMDPQNSTYLKRYEELLARTRVADYPGRGSVRTELVEQTTMALLAFGVIVALAALYVGLAPESPALQKISFVSTWTVGVIVMQFLCGVSAGACFSAGNLLDRVDAVASGRMGPTVTLGLVAVISFPAACALYVLIGLVQRGFNLSTTHIVLGVTVSTAMLAVGSAFSPAEISPVQVLLWGGNLGYLGALCGWVVADSFRR